MEVAVVVWVTEGMVVPAVVVVLLVLVVKVRMLVVVSVVCVAVVVAVAVFVALVFSLQMLPQPGKFVLDHRVCE